jgi:hypothetical protein
MEARKITLACLALASLTFCGAGYRTENFIVTASTPQLARTVAERAEGYRKQLAIYWLGKELPRWPDACPIQVLARPNLGAGGATTFTFFNGTVGRWSMNVQGTEERILDSVLPHEITHTVLATHFAPLGKPVPRWADEGACTTVEHVSERSKFDRLLIDYLHTGQGISFQELYHMKDYPSDPLPLYAEGYSLVSFLVAQGGPRKFVQYLHDGMVSDDWAAATTKHYKYEGLGHVKKNWLAWVGDGGGDVSRYAAAPISQDVILASTSTPLSEIASTSKSTEEMQVRVAAANAPARSWHHATLGISGGVRPINPSPKPQLPQDPPSIPAKTVLR